MNIGNNRRLYPLSALITGVFFSVFPIYSTYAVDQSLTVQTLLRRIAVELINPIIVFLFILATLIFVWGVVLYVIGSQGGGDKLKTAKSVILWGLIGMFIMSSGWGIVNLLCNFFDTCSGQIIVPSSSQTSNTANTPNTSNTTPTAPQAPNTPPSSGGGVAQGGACTGTGQAQCQTGLTCILGFCNAAGPGAPPGTPPNPL